MNLLMMNGVLVDWKEKRVNISCLTCDAPARSLLKGIVQHTGYYSCERCTAKDFSIRNRIVFDKEGPSIKHDNETFRRNVLEDLNSKRHQLSESAFLTELSSQLLKLNGSFLSEFARQPRSVSELDRWKATELRSFLLYSGPVILRPLLPAST